MPRFYNITVDGDGGFIEFESGAALNMKDGSTITMEDGSTLTLQDGSDMNLQNGATFDIAGDVQFVPNGKLFGAVDVATGLQLYGGDVTIMSAATLHWNAGAFADLDNGAALRVQNSANTEVGVTLEGGGGTSGRGLLNITQYGELKFDTGSTVTGSMGMASGSLISRHAASADARFILLEEYYVDSDSIKARFYLGTDVSPDEKRTVLVRTINARWDQGTTNWVKDDTGEPAYRVDHPFTADATGATDSGMRVAQMDEAGPWSEATWWATNDNILKLGWDLIGADKVGALMLNSDDQLTKGATPEGHTLYSKSMVKAWGFITTNGSGGLTLNDGFNIEDPPTWVGSGIDVDFRRNMANGDYAVVFGNSQEVYVVWVDNGSKSAAGFQLYYNEYDGTPVEPSSNITQTMFIVCGESV